MPFEAEFIDGVLASSTPITLSTKADLVAYYQEQYPRSWGAQLSRDLAAITGGNPRNIARRFNPDRVHSQPKPGSAQAAEYELLGEQIGPIGYIAPEEGYELTFVGEIAISRKCYPRSFIRTITGDDAQALADAAFAGMADYMALFREYFDGEDVAEGFCGDPEIIIEPIGGHTVVSPAPKLHKTRVAYAQRGK